MNAVRSATWAGIAAILLWSSLALLTVASGALPPLQVLATGFGIAGLAGTLVTASRGRTGWQAWRVPPAALALAVAGLFGYHALYFFALKRAPAVEANLINYLWPLLIVLFSARLPGMRLRAGHLFGALLGFAAAALLIAGGASATATGDALAGYAAAFLAAVTWAGYSVLNRRFAAVPGSAIVPACLMVALLGALAHVAFERTVAPSAGQWIVLLGMGLGPVGIAFRLWDAGTRHGDLALLGSLSYLAPLLSTLLLVAAGRAEPRWSQALAVVLLTGGAWLSMQASARSA
ncbi:MAG: DMT family transporter [Proteobacteria bacterium]|mgnify:CR=1 FL=1|nr:DMT family transporter [Pseudomonadota bacterium]